MRSAKGSALIALLLAVALGALAELTGIRWFVLGAGAVFALLMFGLFTRPTTGGMRIRCRDHGVAVVGERLLQCVIVANEGRRWSPETTLFCWTRRLEDFSLYVPPLAPGDKVHLDVGRAATERGVTEGAAFTLSTADALGLFAADATMSMPTYRLVVHPAPAPPDLTAVRRVDIESAAEPTTRGRGPEPVGVREWRPGDSARRVHWRSTARRDQLMVLERGQAPARAVVLVVVGPSDAPDWETVVSVAASTCRVARTAGTPVTVLAWRADGALLAAPGGGARGLPDWWAALPDVAWPSPHTVLGELDRAGARDAVIVASSGLPDAWWMSLAEAAALTGVHVRRLRVGG